MGDSCAQGPLIERRLMQQWGPGQLLNQDNRFYDTADSRLRYARMSLRLRRENEQVVLTVKQRKAVSTLHHQHEEECQVNTTIWAVMHDAPTIDPRPLPIPGHLRALVGAEALVNLGGLPTAAANGTLTATPCALTTAPLARPTTNGKSK